MVKRVYSCCFLNISSLVISFLLIPFVTFSQAIIIKGIVKDEQTLNPIPAVNIKVYGESLGTSTDVEGGFVLKLNKVPGTLAITCLGYEDSYFDIMRVSNVPM